MMTNKEREQRRIDKFKRLYARTQGGIFTQKTRNRLLTKRGISAKGRTKSQFWYRQRENVKTALVDLRLFIKEAGKSNVNQVVNVETLKPVVNALLNIPLLDELPDRKRAEIAELFIRAGFEYMRAKSGNHITLPYERTMAEALSMTRYLVKYFREQ